MDPVQEKLAIRIANDAVNIASLEARIDALISEVARLTAGAPAEAASASESKPKR